MEDQLPVLVRNTLFSTSLLQKHKDSVETLNELHKVLTTLAEFKRIYWAIPELADTVDTCMKDIAQLFNSMDQVVQTAELYIHHTWASKLSPAGAAVTGPAVAAAAVAGGRRKASSVFAPEAPAYVDGTVATPKTRVTQDECFENLSHKLPELKQQLEILPRRLKIFVTSEVNAFQKLLGDLTGSKVEDWKRIRSHCVTVTTATLEAAVDSLSKLDALFKEYSTNFEEFRSIPTTLGGRARRSSKKSKGRSRQARRPHTRTTKRKRRTSKPAARRSRRRQQGRW